MADDARYVDNAYTRLPGTPQENLKLSSKESNVSSSSPRSRFRTGFKFLLVSAVLYLVVPWQFLSSEYDSDDTRTPASAPLSSATEDSLPVCAAASPAAPKSPVLDSVWTSLSVEEAVAIRTWLFEPEQGFNLTSGESAEAKYVPLPLSLFPQR